MLISNSWAKCIIDVVSFTHDVSAALLSILNLNKKISQIYFLSNSISLV